MAWIKLRQFSWTTKLRADGQLKVDGIKSVASPAPFAQLRLRDEPFRASALHIRSFVTESLGLGMLTASVQTAYRWYGRGNIHNLDALPTALAARYRGRGRRPDLLFDTPAMRLAGEARGRSHKPPDRHPGRSTTG